MLRSAHRLKRLNWSNSLRLVQCSLTSVSANQAVYFVPAKPTRQNADSHNIPPPISFPVIHLVNCHRSFSTTSRDGEGSESMSSGTFSEPDDMSSTSTTFDETMDKIFTATQQQMLDAEAAEAAAVAAKEAGLIWEPALWKPTDLAVEAIRFVHDTTGWEYGWSIIGVTVGVRLLLFPLFAMTKASQSRMAHMSPELNAIMAKYKKLGQSSPAELAAYTKQMNALYKKYDTTPWRGLWLPVVTLPVFLGMFFGLQKMAKYPVFHPDLSTGGILWFTDLTVPDPFYVLSVSAALTFLAVIEVSRDANDASGMSPGTKNLVHNFMRGLALVMVPASLTFPSAVVAYWTTNNLCTFVQAGLLTLKPVKKAMGIWDPPKPVPGAPSDSITSSLSNLINPKPTEEQLIKKHNDKIESQQKMKELSKEALSLRRQGRAVGRSRK